jgi:type II secretory pathway predicted ATPase ExeA
MSFVDMLHRNAPIHPKNQPAPLFETCTTEVSRQDRPHSFFASPLLARKLAALHKLAGKSRLIVITGEHGIGKTTFIHKFMSEGTGTWRSATIRFSAPGQSAAHQCYQAAHRRVFVSRSGALPSLIIDDAHQLGLMELRAVIHGVCPVRSPAVLGSVILLAESSIREHIDAMLRWMPTGTAMEKMHLSALTEAHTAHYLHHQLKRIGCLGNFPLTEAHIHRIYQASGGIPGLIDPQVEMMLREPTAKAHSGAETLLKWWRMRKSWRTRPWARRIESIGSSS